MRPMRATQAAGESLLCLRSFAPVLAGGGCCRATRGWQRARFRARCSGVLGACTAAGRRLVVGDRAFDIREQRHKPLKVDRVLVFLYDVLRKDELAVLGSAGKAFVTGVERLTVEL